MLNSNEPANSSKKKILSLSRHQRLYLKSKFANRVWPLAAEVVEVVQVYGVERGAAVSVLDDELCLAGGGLCVVVAHPLAAAVSVGAAGGGAGGLGQLVRVD